ncbi:uncharacterized protein LOC111039468 [Myzus persicae]|uniref:uncharacterized protein LOC111039468 n=1 Tax=Myzus persicae TaxID=13164 RepID=UPI000B933831|nr:uncharacterized protein LOC111039468 [Myzus persicae]
MGISVDNFFQLKFEESQFFIDHYQGLLDLSKFNIQSEMTVAKNIILQSGNEINYNTIKQNISKSVFPNLYKLLQVAITIPISSATCERSFSAMRKVKTWLRTSMLQEKFNNSSILPLNRAINSLNNKMLC